MAAGLAGRWTFSGTREIKLSTTSLSSNLIDHEYFRLGPAINYRFGRASVDDQIVSLMTDIDDTVEQGFTAGREFKNGANPRYRFDVSVEFIHDVGDTREGYTIRSGIHYWAPLGAALDFGVRADLTYGDRNYTSTYFGVSVTDSDRSGLTQLNADGGLRETIQTIPFIMKDGGIYKNTFDFQQIQAVTIPWRRIRQAVQQLEPASP